MNSCFCCETIDDVDLRFNQRRGSVKIVDVKKSLRVSDQVTSNPNANSKPKTFYDYKDTLMCFFCGGKKCKHEDYLRHSNPAIKGLNSDQIDSNIFASQRPSNILINNFDLIDQFKNKGIGLVINVQRPGEHPYCGPNGGLDPESGFTYTPSLFTSEAINVKLCGWKDMNVPDSLTFMLDIVKEMHYAINIQQKKVLVHCHAGYGRTGIVIACYKIFSENLSSEDAIKEIRAIRSKSVQKSSQQQYCFNFSRFISQMKEIFKPNKGDIKLLIQYQNSLSLDNTSTLPFVPKMITESFNAIRQLRKSKQIPLKTIFQSLNGTIPFIDQIDSCLQVLINSINRGNWESLYHCSDIVLISELLYVWFDESVKCCINPNRVDELFNENIIKTNSIISNNSNSMISSYTINVIESIDKVIQKHLRKYEYETIVYIANFIEGMKQGHNDDDEDNDIREAEMHLKEKLCTFLLGYNIQFLYDHKEYHSSIQKLIQLITYLQTAEGLKRITIRKAITISQNKTINFNTSSYRSQVIKTVDLNQKINEEEEQELFNYYLLLQDHFQQSQSINNNNMISGSSKVVIYGNKTARDTNNNNNGKDEVFKSSVYDHINDKESNVNTQRPNDNDEELFQCNNNANDKESQVYRNKIRNTKQLKLSQYKSNCNSNSNGNGNDNDNDNKIKTTNGILFKKKLWIKEKDC